MSKFFYSRIFSGDTLNTCFSKMELFFKDAYEWKGREVDLQSIKIIKNEKGWKVFVIYKVCPSQSNSVRVSGHVFKVFLIENEDDVVDRIDDFMNAHLSETVKVVFFDIYQGMGSSQEEALGVLICKTR